MDEFKAVIFKGVVRHGSLRAELECCDQVRTSHGPRCDQVTHHGQCLVSGDTMSRHTPQSQGAHDTRHTGGLCDVVTSRDTLHVSVTLPGHSIADTH